MSCPNESPLDDSVWRRLQILFPLLVLADDGPHAAAVAVAACVVLIAANVGFFALRALVPQHVRLPAFALAIGLFATTAVLLMRAFVFDLSERTALFAAIIAAICMNLAHADRTPARAFGRTFVDAIATGQTFGIVLIALGLTRGAAGGTLPPAVTAPAVFLFAGLSIALKNALARRA